MKTDEQKIQKALSPEIQKLIFDVSTNYVGQMDDLYKAVGMLVVGRLYGWHVMRLGGSKPDWELANRLFGDIKLLLPKRGEFAGRSLGLAVADRMGHFWEIIRGTVKVPSITRKALTSEV